MPCQPCVQTKFGMVSVAASTSPPTGSDLYAGKLIWESDTQLLRRYDGTSWRSLPQGVVGRTIGTASAYTNATAVASDITVSAGTAPSLSLALLTSHLYRVSFVVCYSLTTATSRAVFDFTVNGVVTYTWTIVPGSTVSVELTGAHTFTPASGASVVYKLQARSPDVGTLSLVPTSATHSLEFTIEDIGS